ncbi:hypothetical protein COP00_07915 [Bacillus glycinifermentans]|uniref:Uncharacterized protein n=1 Tax=Bacillus glycinifermentans TaxID=1664069 RepID=A0A0T6BUK0_9BACI|nr:hypothetical protein COP00_07915 [Bacillus glycinifermentans]KRT95301.1 hypothetical protein AB447_212445 [Bacillus glycinifermentans]
MYQTLCDSKRLNEKEPSDDSSFLLSSLQPFLPAMQTEMHDRNHVGNAQPAKIRPKQAAGCSANVRTCLIKQQGRYLSPVAETFRQYVISHFSALSS